VSRTVGTPNAAINLVEEQLGEEFSKTLGFGLRTGAPDLYDSQRARLGTAMRDHGYRERPVNFWTALDPATKPTIPADPMNPKNLYLDPWDDRTFAPHAWHNVYPLTTNVAQAGSLSGSTLKNTHCSGNMVGLWTALTAAHCLWNYAANQPISSAAATVGVVSSGSRVPFGPWTITSQSRFKPTQAWGCYDLYVPNGWKVGATIGGIYYPPGDWRFDMGVIEFGCYLPGEYGNWIAVGWRDEDYYYANNEVYLEAYDSLKHEADFMGRDEMNWTGFADPTLRRRYSGVPNTLNIHPQQTWFLETDTIDWTKGSSGGCAQQKIWGSASYWFCSGVVSHGIGHDGNDYGGIGRLRRFDPEFWSFLQTRSEF
jgi:hypothetical protein